MSSSLFKLSSIYSQRIIQIIILTIILSYSLQAPSAFGLIGTLSVFKNPATGKYIILMGDTHSQGTQESNLQQMQLFLDLLKEADQAAVKIDLLHEHMRSYCLTQTTPCGSKPHCRYEPLATTPESGPLTKTL